MTGSPTTSELSALLPFLTPRERDEMDSLLTADPLAWLRTDPSAIMRAAGLTPDPWQRRLIRTPSARGLVLCSRSAGKSEAAAALALADVLLHPGSLVLVLSPSERQSAEFAAKVSRFYQAVGCPVRAAKWTDLRLDLANGSRLIALPGNERTVRTYNGARRLVIDEASRVPDDLYRTVRPMVAVSGGAILALSTPFGKRGWFWKEYESGGPIWRRERVTAWQCQRIPRAFLEEEKATLGDRWFCQEYECSFEDAVGAAFSAATIAAAMSDDLQPLF